MSEVVDNSFVPPLKIQKDIHTEMTLRDYFAGQALISLAWKDNDENVARNCYQLADAMMEERKR